MSAGEAAGHARMPNLVTRSPLGRTNQGTRCPVVPKLAGKPAKRMHRAGFEPRHASEVRPQRRAATGWEGCEPLGTAARASIVAADVRAAASVDNATIVRRVTQSTQGGLIDAPVWKAQVCWNRHGGRVAIVGGAAPAAHQERGGKRGAHDATEHRGKGLTAHALLREWQGTRQSTCRLRRRHGQRGAMSVPIDKPRSWTLPGASTRTEMSGDGTAWHMTIGTHDGHSWRRDGSPSGRAGLAQEPRTVQALYIPSTCPKPLHPCLEARAPFRHHLRAAPTQRSASASALTGWKRPSNGPTHRLAVTPPRSCSTDVHNLLHPCGLGGRLQQGLGAVRV